MTNTSDRLRRLDREIRAAAAREDVEAENALSADFQASLDGLEDEHLEGEHDGDIVVDCDSCRDDAKALGIKLPAKGTGPAEVAPFHPRSGSSAGDAWREGG